MVDTQSAAKPKRIQSVANDLRALAQLFRQLHKLSEDNFLRTLADKVAQDDSKQDYSIGRK